jgi:hypothetical protein
MAVKTCKQQKEYKKKKKKKKRGEEKNRSLCRIWENGAVMLLFNCLVWGLLIGLSGNFPLLYSVSLTVFLGMWHFDGRGEVV